MFNLSTWATLLLGGVQNVCGKDKSPASFNDSHPLNGWAFVATGTDSNRYQHFLSPRFGLEWSWEKASSRRSIAGCLIRSYKDFLPWGPLLPLSICERTRRGMRQRCSYCIAAAPA
jgi:hypothetical protein